MKLTRWLFLSLCLWAGTALAAEDEEAPAPTEEAAAETTDEAEASSPSADDSKPFVPSEEISEDLAVSFPVDI